MAKKTRTLEVHTHSYLGNDWSMRSRNPNKPDIEHAHEGGDRPHLHPDCGPATYTIDKDAWAAATGLKGGGRKKFTAAPTGPQLPLVERPPQDNTFQVIFVDEYTPGHASAGISPEQFALMRAAFIRDAADARASGGHAVARMEQEFGMTPIYELRKPE